MIAGRGDASGLPKGVLVSAALHAFSKLSVAERAEAVAAKELLDTHERAQDLLRAPSEPVIEIPDRNKPVPPAA